MGFFSSLKNIIGSTAKNQNNREPLDSNQLPTDWKNTLTLALRNAEPKLSIWLSIILEDCTQVGPQLWERIHFLLLSLGISESEATIFIQKFTHWITAMGYTQIIEFRSELQYRLALALELEDEEDERNRLIEKIHTGLTKTREHFSHKLAILFSKHTTLSDQFWDDLEELFITADMGIDTTTQLIKILKRNVQTIQQDITPESLQPLLANELKKIFSIPKKIIAFTPPEVILLIGVNGVGKTTTIAKLAYRNYLQGKKVLLIAADTFRAAAIEQLEVWSKKIDVAFYGKDTGSDPAAVVWEGLTVAMQQDFDCVLIDTAGRLHTKKNLIDELTKIRTVITKKHPGAPHRTILIIDATTGQNALQQAKIFKESAAVDEVILTKIDGTAKGGIAIAVSMQYGLPITYVGLGEQMEDLRPFDGEVFAQSLLTQHNKTP